MDRGSASYAPTAQTTEWDDVLIKHGIRDRDDVLREKGINPDEIRLKEELEKIQQEVLEQHQSLTVEDHLKAASLDELDELEDELDDDNMLQQYREQRLAELKLKAQRDRFGEVYEINKAEWVKEVTEASNETWVLAHLYQDSVVECRVLERALDAVAHKFKHVKFVRIRSTQAIENWPDSNLPALFMYKGGTMVKQLIGLETLGGKQTQAEDLEWYLAGQGIVETELEDDPARNRSVNTMQIRRGGRTQRDSDSETDA